MDKVRGIMNAILLAWVLFSVSAINAQGSQVKTLFSVKNVNTIAPECYSDELHTKLMQTDSKYKARHEDLEKSIQSAIENESFSKVGVLTVPIVVHIIHTGEAIGSGSNISDEQVYSAITALNEDYRKMAGTNGDGNGVDCEIEFCLAVRDPQGNPSTGINRVNGSSLPNYASEGISIGAGSGADEVAVKNLSRWPKSDYYNIWIVNEINDNDGGSGTQGFAYFPSAGPSVDGAVLLYNAFGTVGNLKSYTNMNRVTTHEIGHGLNLYHTFQGNSCTESNCSTEGDRVCDTPPTVGNSTNCGAPSCGGNQQVENYLDYTSQTCKNMFTNGQKTRMRAALTGARASLLTSNGCAAVTQYDAGIDEIISPSGSICDGTISPLVVVRNYGSSTLNSFSIQYAVDGNNSSYTFSGSLQSGSTVEVQLPSMTVGAGTHSFTASTSMPNGQQDQYTSNDSQSSNFALVSGSTLTVSFVQDFYGAHNTWELLDASGNVIAQDGPFSGEYGDEHTKTVCAPQGCYTFIMYDSYGDGLIGIAGYELTDSELGIVASGGGSDVGSEESTNFCLGGNGGGQTGTAPSAEFSGNMTSVCAGEAISFTDMSTGDPTSWSWNFSGATNSISSNQNPTGIVYNTPGTYTVTLTASNASGSDVEVKTNYITIGEGTVVTGAVTNVSCHGENVGAIALMVSGAGNTYSWSNGGTTQSINGLYSGTYNVLVTNGTGCQSMSYFTVSEPSALNISVINVTADVDNAGIGSASIDITGGVPPYNVSWSNGVSTMNISNVSAGSYSVDVVDANGCSISQTINIVNNDSNNTSAPEAQFSVDSEQICAGSSVTFMNMSTNSPTAWLWEFEGAVPSTSTAMNPSGIRYDNAGSHDVTLTVSNSYGSDTKLKMNFMVVNETPILTTNIQNTSCHGTDDGSIDLNINGGASPYSVNWSNGAMQEDVTMLVAGQYSVTVSDANGCLKNDAFVIEQPDNIQFSVIGNVPDSCGLGTGSVMIVPNGGTPGYSVSWNDPSQQTDFMLANVHSGEYVAMVSDANDCTSGIAVFIGDTGCGATGIEEFADISLELFPNPFDGSSIFLKYNSTNQVTVEMYDISGSKLVVSIVDTGSQVYEIRPENSLADGMYILRIINGQDIITKKVVVRK